MAPDTQEVQLREDNTLHAAEMFPTVKTIKAAGCDEIWTAMFTALKRSN